MIYFINHSRDYSFYGQPTWYHRAIMCNPESPKKIKSKLFVGGSDSQKCHGREAMKRWVSELINRRASKTPVLRVSAARLGASSSAVFYSRKVDLLTKKNQRGSSANANGLHGGSRNLSLSVLRIAGQAPSTDCHLLRLIALAGSSPGGDQRFAACSMANPHTSPLLQRALVKSHVSHTSVKRQHFTGAAGIDL